MNTDILYEAERLHAEIAALKAERDALRTCAENDTSVISLAPGHGQGVSRTMENILIRAADIDTLIKAKQTELDEKTGCILSAVAKLDDSLQRTVITMHYVMFKTWDETAALIGYEKRYCKKIASTARTLLKTI